MKNCVIFCAGDFRRLAEPLVETDFVIAADGGLKHLSFLGVQPDAVLGDFDSLGYVPEGARVYPVEKDDTDAMLAIRLGLEQGCDRFMIYGGLDGDRVDHTVANFQALRFLEQRNARGYLLGLTQAATVIENRRITFPQNQRGILSVFCMGDRARGVTLRGLKYNLEDGTLEGGLPLGVSNQFVGEKAEISVKNGCLLLIWQREWLDIR
ncbi:MAG: thiamine diphosphokinase [Oscillospiraceae bacterium]|nr:thiamine diphosphokinase [Oscillospiraceae bacterium]